MNLRLPDESASQHPSSGQGAAVTDSITTTGTAAPTLGAATGAAAVLGDPAAAPYDEYDELDPAPDLDGPEVEALIGADRHMAAIRTLRAQEATINQIYEAERKRIEDRYEARMIIISRAVEWHTRPIRQLHDRLVEADPKRKTIELPNGTMRMRVSQKPQVWIDDMDTVVEWALERAPDLLPPPKRVNVTDLRKLCDVVPSSAGGFRPVDPSTGEIIPGTHAAVPRPTWNVDTEPGEAF